MLVRISTLFIIISGDVDEVDFAVPKLFPRKIVDHLLVCEDVIPKSKWLYFMCVCVHACVRACVCTLYTNRNNITKPSKLVTILGAVCII